MGQADLSLGDGALTPSPGLAATLAHGMDFFDRPAGVVLPQFASSLSSSLGGPSSDGNQAFQAPSSDQSAAAPSTTTNSRDYDRFSDPVAGQALAMSAYDGFSGAVGNVPRSVSAPPSNAVAGPQAASGPSDDPTWESILSQPNGDAASYATSARALGPSLNGFADYLSAGADALAGIPRDIPGYASDLVHDPLEFFRRAGPTFVGLGASIPTAGVGTTASSAAATDLGALSARANEIHRVLDSVAQTKRTTAILRTDLGDIVAGGGRDLDVGQKAILQAGEIAASFRDAHAEATALAKAQQLGAIPRAIAVTRTICPACAKLIEDAGGILTSARTAIFPNK